MEGIIPFLTQTSDEEFDIYSQTLIPTPESTKSCSKIIDTLNDSDITDEGNDVHVNLNKTIESNKDDSSDDWSMSSFQFPPPSYKRKKLTFSLSNNTFHSPPKKPWWEKLKDNTMPIDPQKLQVLQQTSITGHFNKTTYNYKKKTELLTSTIDTQTKDCIIQINDCNEESKQCKTDEENKQHVEESSLTMSLRKKTLPNGFYNEDSDDSSLGDKVYGDGCTHLLALTHQYGKYNNGVKTLVTLENKTFLGVYTGDLLNYEEMVARQRTSPIILQYIVCIIPRELYICGKYNGNILKMINNHCTKPNCKLYVYKNHLGQNTVGLWTTKKINAGTTLHYKYNIDNVIERNYPGIQCLCQGKNMSGQVICKTLL
jgi:hypothetical protein